MSIGPKGTDQPRHVFLRRRSVHTAMSRINVDLSNERAPYSRDTFTEEQLVSKTDPLLQFKVWFEEAKKCVHIQEANAVSLSTCSKEGKPSSRMVLIKTFTDAGFTFYTNYESRKGRELQENPNAALLFYWPQLHYQVRIEGTVKRLPEEESAAYFHSRPKVSQASAVASAQSTVISSRSEIVTKQQEQLDKYKDSDHVIPKPDYWGGYILTPSEFEFWQGQSNRLHDRIVFTKDAGTGNWSIKRLAP